MGQGSLGEVESIVSPVAEAVARELEPVQRGLTQAGAQVSASLNLCSVQYPSYPGVPGKCRSSGAGVKILRASPGLLQAARKHNSAQSHVEVNKNYVPNLAETTKSFV